MYKKDLQEKSMFFAADIMPFWWDKRNNTIIRHCFIKVGQDDIITGKYLEGRKE